MSKLFTLPEAQALVPEVQRRMSEAARLRKEYEDAERAVQAITARLLMMGGVVLDRAAAAEAKSRAAGAAAGLRSTIEEVHALGCVVKDLETGLVDFPTLLRGVEVCLCWKLGEATIAFWHGTEEGFRGRKPIDQDFLDHHSGGTVD